MLVGLEENTQRLHSRTPLQATEMKLVATLADQSIGTIGLRRPKATHLLSNRAPQDSGTILASPMWRCWREMTFALRSSSLVEKMVRPSLSFGTHSIFSIDTSIQHIHPRRASQRGCCVAECLRARSTPLRFHSSVVTRPTPENLSPHLLQHLLRMAQTTIWRWPVYWHRRWL